MSKLVWFWTKCKFFKSKMQSANRGVLPNWHKRLSFCNQSHFPLDCFFAMANLFLRVPDDIKALLDARADSKNQTTNALANEILRQYLQGSDSELQSTVRDLVERVATLESKMQSRLIANPPTKPYPIPLEAPAPRTAPDVAGYSADTGLSQADALEAAGFPATPANAGRWCRANGWESPAAWLKAQGWHQQGRKWFKPPE